MNHILRLILVAGALTGTSLSAQPAPIPPPGGTLAELVASARAARLKGDVTGWLSDGMKALALTPDHPDILISVARANAAAGEQQKALGLLEQAVRRGAAFDPGRFPEFKALVDDAGFQALAAEARRNVAPTGAVTAFADLTDQESEGVAYDPVSKRLFAGTEKGDILAIGLDGKVSTFTSGGGLRQILGMKVDANRRLLWLVTGRYAGGMPAGPDAPSDLGTGGIRAYHLDNASLVRSAELDERPQLHGFNDVALRSDGTVFLTDTTTHSVYKLEPQANKLELLLRDSRMTFPNGIALSADQGRLYVAHVEGISAVDVTSGNRSLLRVPTDGSVNSIDGLLLHQGRLYGVQNSPYLNRVIGMALSNDGGSIDKVWKVSGMNPAEYSQTTATIAGDHIYMIGGSPMPDIYGGTNSVKPDRKIWRVPIDADR